MVASKDDEDDAYKKFAEACGKAWAPKGSSIAIALTKTTEREEAVAAPDPHPAEIRPKARSIAKTGL